MRGILRRLVASWEVAAVIASSGFVFGVIRTTQNEHDAIASARASAAAALAAGRRIDKLTAQITTLEGQGSKNTARIAQLLTEITVLNAQLAQHGITPIVVETVAPSSSPTGTRAPATPAPTAGKPSPSATHAPQSTPAPPQPSPSRCLLICLPL